MTPGWSTKSLSSTRLLVLGGLLQRRGVALPYREDKDTGSLRDSKKPLLFPEVGWLELMVVLFLIL